MIKSASLGRGCHLRPIIYPTSSPHGPCPPAGSTAASVTCNSIHGREGYLHILAMGRYMYFLSYVKVAIPPFIHLAVSIRSPSYFTLFSTTLVKGEKTSLKLIHCLNIDPSPHTSSMKRQSSRPSIRRSSSSYEMLKSPNSVLLQPCKDQRLICLHSPLVESSHLTVSQG